MSVMTLNINTNTGDINPSHDQMVVIVKACPFYV